MLRQRSEATPEDTGAPGEATRERAPRRFFATDAATLARRLLGQRLVRVLPDGTRLSGLIAETEAYLGVRDRASHAFNGRRTPRNEAMYAGPGTSYVYFTYGMHFCFNVVCGREGEPPAVLVRALIPEEGLDRMRAHRAEASRRPPASLGETDLCSGPGKLCRALAIGREHNGLDLATDPWLFVERAGCAPRGEQVGVSPRIGIAFAGEWAKSPLRWFIRGCPHVSRRAG